MSFVLADKPVQKTTRQTIYSYELNISFGPIGPDKRNRPKTRGKYKMDYSDQHKEFKILQKRMFWSNFKEISKTKYGH